MSTKLYLVVSSNDDGTKTVDGIYSSILKADASVGEDSDPGKMIFTVPVNEVIPAKLGSLVFKAPIAKKTGSGFTLAAETVARATANAALDSEYDTVPAGL